MSGVIKLKIIDLNNQYKKINIICISDTYLGNKLKLQWKCLICDYIFMASKNYLDKDFTQCKGCFKINQLIKAKNFAIERGGICLTKKYNKSTEKIIFKCKERHIFKTKYSNAISNGHWCSVCSKNNNISEEICRAYFENMFGEKFKTVRPDWLINSTGHRLELDGFCLKLNIAFEHNGIFHYPNKMKNSMITNQNDLNKLNLCLLHNVKLIVIEQLFNKTPLNNLRKTIVNKCAALNIFIPYPLCKVDLSSCYSNKNIDSIIFYNNLAKSRGGKCLSQYCGATNEKLIWQCKNNHKWKQFPYVIKRGHWCPICSGQLHSKNIINDKI